MNKDPLFINKIAAAILVAALLGMVSAELASALYHPHEAEEQAFVIADPDTATDVAAAPADAAPAGPADILPMLASADIGKGEKVAKKCVACHDFTNGGPNKVGPNLWGVVNEPKASRDFAYSDALKGVGGEWDYDALNHFLYSPKDFAPGTKMSFKGVSKDDDRAALIAYLRTLAASPAPLP